MTKPRWFHWLGLVVVVAMSLLLGAVHLFEGSRTQTFPLEDPIARILGFLGLVSVILLVMRKRAGFVLAAPVLALDGVVVLATVVMAYFVDGVFPPTAFQWFGFAIVALVFAALAATTWRLQRAFVAG